MSDGEAVEALRRIPGYETAAAPSAVERLGGLTNRVYRLRGLDEETVLRLPGPGTEDYIDRKVEQCLRRPSRRSPKCCTAIPAAASC